MSSHSIPIPFDMAVRLFCRLAALLSPVWVRRFRRPTLAFGFIAVVGWRFRLRICIRRGPWGLCLRCLCSFCRWEY